jgi:hypothetical protein
MSLAGPSAQSLIVVALCNGRQLGTGTGFVVRHVDQPYLITNYHVAAGRDPSTGQPLHASGAVPDTLRTVHLMAQRGPHELRWESRDEPVLELPAERALWLQHPVHGRRVDVVALPLRNLEGVEVHPHALTTGPNDLKAGVSDGVSIIGFPFGLTAGGALGIWTRGFVASEPDIDFDDLPVFLVDARTRPGQSGSPVIVYSSGGPTATADGKLAFFGGPVVTFLGVYSGRINNESDLGKVWKAQAVREILAAQQPGAAGL